MFRGCGMAPPPDWYPGETAPTPPPPLSTPLHSAVISYEQTATFIPTDIALQEFVDNSDNSF